MAQVGGAVGGRPGRANRRGTCLWVRYRGYPFFHQRLVVAESSDGESYAVVTPDFVCYLETYGWSNQDVDAAYWGLDDGASPPEVPRNQAYRFAAWPTAERLTTFYAEGAEHVRRWDTR